VGFVSECVRVYSVCECVYVCLCVQVRWVSGEYTCLCMSVYAGGVYSNEHMVIDRAPLLHVCLHVSVLDSACDYVYLCVCEYVCVCVCV